ncbi:MULTISPECIES: accessory Sec system glycosylation chaperone GtfB [Mammaliicoccus]|uniref:UDP-N-acetylglucosamine--peptide N-acetylglucosaminyltransferase stabilizing protein GtfB n=1 Tax=Mammaliicoccus lentus TaxID=42858 RepID=A0ABS6GYP0_MAMLE|nr:accessory Sec system glycosylation chaperone GtfB [Mammaliicoccus lentus]MBF0840661.1 accessory Sec system glycosylation chaperone GtfB [Mammaliicoccus lentus]MBU6113451.1 accessory Sec system glycosylation chaperone GtfB [Mammaliicoccus lentus]
MINLFEAFDKQTIVLYNSFKFSNIKRQTIVIEADGFLPEDVKTPYEYFANNEKMPIKPLFFNQVKTPEFWMIEGNNNEAVIKDTGEIKARIIYKKNYKHRIVERIEWLNNQGHTQYIDYYNKYGYRYAQVLLDPNTHRRILKRYFNAKGEVFIVENFITNDVILNWKDKEYFFHSKIQFVNFYIQVAGLESEQFLINSFSIPAAVMNGLNASSNDYLYWQGDITSDVIRHMENILSKERRSFSIIVPGNRAYEKVKESISDKWKNRIRKSGYVYNFLKSNNHSNQVLILTNSDQIPHLKEIVQAQPHLDFHIAAMTEMSKNLLDFNKHTNVKLYPNAKKSEFKALYEKCDIYLDINKGNEILDAVRAAFDYKLLILGYEATAHNNVVTAPINLFDVEYPHTLITRLEEVTQNNDIFDKYLELQLEQANAIDKVTFIESVK